MKATLTLTFNDQQLRGMLDSLSITDCKTAIKILQNRIDNHNTEQLISTVKRKAWGGNFLDTPIEEFELTHRTKKQLLRIDIKTVRDLTEVGLERLMCVRNIGKGTVAEIKMVVFQQEVDYL